MKIGLLIYGDLDIQTGGYLYDRMLVRHLRNSGDQVTIFSINSYGYWRNLAHNFSSSLIWDLRRHSIDLLLQDELNHPSLFILNQRLKAAGKFPIISIVHHLRSSEPNSLALNWFYRLVELQYLKHVDGFVFNSQSTKKSVEFLVGSQKPSLVSLPAGDHLNPRNNTDQILERAQSEGELKLLFLGSLIPRKGLHLLLQALAELHAEPWQLQIVGDDRVNLTYTKKIKQAIARYGLVERVKLLGSKSSGSIANLLAEQHVLVIPSLYEGYGIAYLEAMGFGLAVIASSAGGASEFIQHKINGYLITPGDYTQLARTIRDLCRNRDALAQIGLAARKTFDQHPTWRENTLRSRAFLHQFGERAIKNKIQVERAIH